MQKQTSDIGETDILAEDLKGLDDTSDIANTDKKEENIEVNENNTTSNR